MTVAGKRAAFLGWTSARRLASQRLVGAPFATPEEVVGWLGAVQAQDYAGAKWAVAQRAAGLSGRRRAGLHGGRILRTHMLRPTWHFVLPDDVRWMLALTAPRVRAAMAYYNRKLGLDEASLPAHAGAACEGARGRPRRRTREELARDARRGGHRGIGPSAWATS